MRLRHYSRRTEEAYVTWIRRFIVFHGKRHPTQMGSEEIQRYLTHLAVERKVSASTQNQALSALLFLYRQVLLLEPGPVEHVPHAHSPLRVPVVLSVSEVRAVLDQLSGMPRIVVALLYGAGLRLRESLELRVKDIDFDRNQIVVRRGKWQKDRRTMLPETVRPSWLRTSERSAANTNAIFHKVSVVWRFPRRSNGNTPMPPPNGAGSLCFLRREYAGTHASGHRPGTTCTNPSCSARSPPPSAERGSRSGPAATPSAIPLRHICSKPGTTFERFRNYSAMRTSVRR